MTAIDALMQERQPVLFLEHVENPISMCLNQMRVCLRESQRSTHTKMVVANLTYLGQLTDTLVKDLRETIQAIIAADPKDTAAFVILGNNSLRGQPVNYDTVRQMDRMVEDSFAEVTDLAMRHVSLFFAHENEWANLRPQSHGAFLSP